MPRKEPRGNSGLERPGPRRTACRAAVFLVLALSWGGLAEAGPITVAWDPSPEPGVTGYVVHVGTRSRVYTETYDAGNSLSFVYTLGRAGQRYYFAVAAYTAEGLTGGASEEVSAEADARGWLVAGASPGAPSVRSPVREGSAPAPRAAESDERGTRQLCDAPGGCQAVQVVARGLGPVGPMAATGDGRLFFIEDERRVRVVTPGGLAAEPALVADRAGSRLTGLVLDPAFDRTRSVLVAETGARPDGSGALTISRYRELRNVLGQRARIISELPVPPAAEAPFTVDGEGHIYVALPAAAHLPRSSRTAYNGFVLRFGADGSVPADNPGASPILSHGYGRTVSLAWDAGGGALWLAGTDARWPHTIARVPGGGAIPQGPPQMPAGIGGEIPGLPDAVVDIAIQMEGPPSRRAEAVTRLVAVTSSGQVHVAMPGRDGGPPAWRTLRLSGGGHVVGVSAGPRGDVYVALRVSERTDGIASFSILRLTPIEP